MGETLNHLKEEPGLTHNDTVLLTIFAAVSYVAPRVYSQDQGVLNQAGLLGGTQRWEVSGDHGKDGRVERNRKDCGKARRVNTGCSFRAHTRRAATQAAYLMRLSER